MPTYDFKCEACDSVVEMRWAHDASDKPLCQKCGSEMRKSYTPPAIQFKGGGWGGQG